MKMAHEEFNTFFGYDLYSILAKFRFRFYFLKFRYAMAYGWENRANGLRICLSGDLPTRTNVFSCSPFVLFLFLLDLTLCVDL